MWEQRLGTHFGKQADISDSPPESMSPQDGSRFTKDASQRNH